MLLLRLTLILTFGNIVASSSLIQHEFPELESSASLAKLLRFVTLEHLGNRDLVVIHEPRSYETHHRGPYMRRFLDFSKTSRRLLLFHDTNVRKNHSNYKSFYPVKDDCANYVIFVERIDNLARIIGNNVHSKIVVVTADSAWEIKDYLKSETARSYLHLIIVVRSASVKSGNGTYLLYTHKLYAEGSGSSEPVLLTSWLNDNFTAKNVDLFPDKLRDGFMGHRLLASVVDNPPFVIKKSLQIAGSVTDEKWDGLEIRMLKLAGAHLNFTVEFSEPRSRATGPMESAKIDVLLGESSTAIGGLYQTHELGDAFDATIPHTDDCAAFISLASTALPKYRAILGPFQLTVWLLLCISYFVLMIPLSFNSNYTLMYLVKHPRGINHMFWYIFSTYTNSFVIKSPLLDRGLAKNSISMLLGIYWLFTIIVTACYTGSIVSFITLPAYPTALETANELLANRYRVGTLDHDGWERRFSANATNNDDDGDPFLRRLFRKIEYVPSVLEGIQNASRAYFWPYAFLASRTSLDYIVQTDFAPTWATKRTLMHISNECFVRYNVVQLYPAKSLYTKSMNDFVLRAKETGLIDRIVTDIDWQVERNAMIMKKQITKRMSQKIKIQERTLTVEDTQGMFLLLGIGFLLATLVLCLECSAGRMKKRKIHDNNDNGIPSCSIDPGNDEWNNVHYFLRVQRVVSARRSF